MSLWLIGTQQQPLPADDWNTAFREPELNTSMWQFLGVSAKLQHMNQDGKLE